MERLQKYYKTIDTIPVYNMDKLITTGDVRYLIHNELDFDSIEISENEYLELKKIADKLFSELPQVDLTLQVLYFYCIEAFFNYISSKSTKQNVNSTFSKYINYLDSNFEKFVWGDFIFETASELYAHLKNISDYDDLICFRLDIFDFQIFKATSKIKKDFLYEVITLRDITNQQIDIFKTSFKEFLSIRKYAINKISIQNAKKI